MSPLTLQLKPSELGEIRYRLSIDEPRVIRRANILNCLHLGYVSSDIAKILNVDPKTVTNVGNAYLEGGLDSALYDVKVPRFRGHLILCVRGVCHGQDKDSEPIEAVPA